MKPKAAPKRMYFSLQNLKYYAQTMTIFKCEDRKLAVVMFEMILTHKRFHFLINTLSFELQAIEVS